jgi:hypothetical protein
MQLIDTRRKQLGRRFFDVLMILISPVSLSGCSTGLAFFSRPHRHSPVIDSHHVELAGHHYSEKLKTPAVRNLGCRVVNQGAIQ